MIVIPGELTDLNTYIRAMNSNRFSGNAIKQDETNRVAWLCKGYKIKKKIEQMGPPYQIHITWYCKNQKKDLDNISFAKKFILDGMVKGGLIQGDGWKYINGFTEVFRVDAKNPRIEVKFL